MFVGRFCEDLSGTENRKNLEPQALGRRARPLGLPAIPGRLRGAPRLCTLSGRAAAACALAGPGATERGQNGVINKVQIRESFTTRVILQLIVYLLLCALHGHKRATL